MNDVAALDLLSGDDSISSLRSILSDAQHNSADDDFLLALSAQSSIIGMVTVMDTTMDMSSSIDCLHIPLYPSLSPSPSPSPQLINDTPVDDADTPDLETTSSPEPLNVAPTDESGLLLSLLHPPPTIALSPDSSLVDGGRVSCRRSSPLRLRHAHKEPAVIVPPPIDLSTPVPTVDLRLPDQRRVRFVLTSRKRRRTKRSPVKPAHVVIRKVGPPISNQLEVPTYDDARPHIRFSKIRILEFPKCADASKVPNSAAFSIGLDYDAIIQEREVTVDEFELTHIHADVMETDIIERQEIWQGTADKHTVALTDNTPSPSTQPASLPSSSSCSSGDVAALVSCDVVLTEVSESLYASQSDVADLYAIRTSRRQVGCNCRAASRRHQLCTETAHFEADTIRVQPKRNKHHALTIITPTTTLAADANSTSTLDIICSCVLAGIECNSNICSCTTSCCSNPNKRYSFDEKKVNSYRRRLLKRLRKSTAYFTDEIEQKQHNNDTHITTINNITTVIIPTTTNNVNTLS